MKEASDVEKLDKIIAQMPVDDEIAVYAYESIRLWFLWFMEWWPLGHCDLCHAGRGCRFDQAHDFRDDPFWE